MTTWNQKFTKDAATAYIAKTEGRRHQYIDESQLYKANEVKHNSKHSFYLAYQRAAIKQK